MKKLSMLFIITPLFLIFTGCNNPVTQEEQIKTENQNSMIEYVNSAHGFSVTYPKETYIADENINPSIEGKFMQVKFVLKNRQKRLQETGGYEMATADIFISVFDSAPNLPDNEISKLSLKEWLKQKAPSQGITDLKEIIFANSPAYKALSGSMNAADPEIYIEHNGKIYLIHNELATANDPQKAENEKVIQTFKFIN